MTVARPMTIGLDHDGVVTLDVEIWLKFIEMMRAAGHIVYLVTMRYRSEIHPLGWDSEFEPIDSRILQAVNGTHCTGRMAKRPFMEAAGIRVDVWCDDHPRSINEDADQIWPKVHPEGSVVTHNVNDIIPPNIDPS